MFVNSYSDNVRLELRNLKQLAFQSNLETTITNYYVKKVEENLSNFSVDEYLHQFEDKIRRKIISTSITNDRFWTYRSIASRSYQDNLEADSNYDRSLPPERIEKFYSNNNKLLDSGGCVVFNSGMAALNSVIMIAQKLKKTPLNAYTNYFETTALLKEITNEVHQYSNIFDNIDDFLNTNFVFLEIPICSPSRKSLNIQDIFESLSKRRDDRLFVLIIDSTLQLKEDNYLSKLLTNKNVIIFMVRSGLKLDQIGLELANLGIVEVYSNIQTKYKVIIEEMLRNYRTVSGLSIDYNSYLRLVDLPFSIKDIQIYKNKIYDNTLEMYKKINSVNSKFFTVQYQTGLPFIYLKPKAIDVKNWVNDLLIDVTENRGYLPYGTSFGFRHTRLEIIDNKKEQPFIRLSPGEYLGRSNELLLKHLENYNVEKYTREI